jgi:hypothetical protein
MPSQNVTHALGERFPGVAAVTQQAFHPLQVRLVALQYLQYALSVCHFGGLDPGGIATSPYFYGSPASVGKRAIIRGYRQKPFDTKIAETRKNTEKPWGNPESRI